MHKSQLMMLTCFFKKIGITTLNDKLLFAFSTVLFLPILFDFITAITDGNSSTYTISIYLGTFTLFFIKFYRSIKIANIIRLLGVYFFFLLNYIIFPTSQPFLSSIEFLLVCLYFISIGLLFITQIKDWSKLTSVVNVFSIPAVLIGIYILFFTKISSGESDGGFFTYMEFSYALLPFICASFARYCEAGNKLTLIVFLLGLFEMLSYGCRGAILSSIIFAIITIVVNGKRHKIILTGFALLTIFIFFNLETIANTLLSYNLFSNSYFLQHFVNGAMFESDRSAIYLLCEERISNMGIEVCGLFGDRPFCGSVYPHNFIYEIMMQFGWFFGTLILLLYSFLIISCLRKRNCKSAVFFIICALLFKYMLSGSYLLSGQFWIATFALMAISSSKVNRKTTNEYTRNFINIS